VLWRDPGYTLAEAACPACTHAAIRLPWDDRVRWMQLYSHVDHHDPRPSLATARYQWLQLNLLVDGSRVCPPMPGDPQPEFWPSFAPPALPPDYDSRGPIAALKAMYRVEDIAGRLTDLHGGDVLTGKCPLHREREGQAFAVWVRDQRWRCFGKCGVGGDVVDLINEARGRGLWTPAT
jgi:hypothetical protein